MRHTAVSGVYADDFYKKNGKVTSAYVTFTNKTENDEEKDKNKIFTPDTLCKTPISLPLVLGKRRF